MGPVDVGPDRAVDTRDLSPKQHHILISGERQLVRVKPEGLLPLPLSTASIQPYDLLKFYLEIFQTKSYKRNIIYYWAIKRNEGVLHVTARMNLTNVTLNP